VENYKAEKKKINGLFLLLCISKALIIGLGYCLSYLLAALSENQRIYEKVVYDVYTYDSLPGILSDIGISILTSAVPLIIYFALKEKGTVRESLFLSKPTFFQTGYVMGTTVIVSSLVSNVGIVFIYRFYDIFGFDPNEYYISTQYPSNLWYIPPLFMLIAFIPALAEEFMFRGAFMGGMKKFGRGFVILMSGLMFMMMHNTLEQLPLALSAGICLAYFTYKFRSLWAPVLTHFVINLDSAIVGTMSGLMSDKDFVFAYMVYKLLFYSLMIGFAVAGAILYGFKLPTVDKPTSQEKKGRARLVFISPFFYIFILLFLFSVGRLVVDVVSFGLN
jgi:membrane protease YdiL (CAAX protease family)